MSATEPSDDSCDSSIVASGFDPGSRDRAFVDQLAAHACASIASAQTAVRASLDPRVRAIAEEVIRVQQRQLDVLALLVLAPPDGTQPLLEPCAPPGPERTEDSALRRLQRTQNELQRSNQHLAAFAGQVSHDLRNPLGAVLMALSLLDECGSESFPDVQASLLRRAIGAAERMMLLIEALLSSASLGGELVRVRVDLDSVLAEVREDLAVQLSSAHMDAQPLPTVVGDPAQLRALLQNLVANAAKFSLPGEPPRIQVVAARTSGGWRIEVRDHGRGLAEADLTRVFEPLVRLNTGLEGSGIGLATCRRIVEAHGGHIGLVRGADHVTRAWFELPEGPTRTR